MKFPNYNKDTDGLETQSQVINQLDEAINVLNTRKECLDKSLWAVVDFIEKIIGQSNNEDEVINDFTTQTMWEAHTVYRDKIFVQIQEWEDLYRPTPPPPARACPYTS